MIHLASLSRRMLYPLSLALALLACARSDVFLPESGEHPTATLSPTQTQTPQPSSTPTITPTATPAPPTATPTPTFTPSITPLPSAEVRILEVASAPEYLLPLRVQHLTPTTAALLFELRTPLAGYLLYRPFPARGNVWTLLELDPSVSRHHLLLEWLRPDSRYQVQVGLGSSPDDLKAPRAGERPWGPLLIRTPPADQTSLRVGVFGDSGFGQKVTRDLVALMASKNLDFVIHVGDLVYKPEDDDGPLSAYLSKLFLPLQPLLTAVPFYPVIGNHDLDAATNWQGDAFYFYAFPPILESTDSSTMPPTRNAWYAFSYGDIRFLMLNSQAFFGDGGREEQTAWLEQQLADSRFRTTIAVFHVPPFTSGIYGDQGAPIRSEWLPLLRQAGVRLILSGHDHNYQRLHLEGGITSIISGGGSSVLYGLEELLPQSQAFFRRTHFVLMEISQDRITLSAIDLDDEVFDRAVIELGEE